MWVAWGVLIISVRLCVAYLVFEFRGGVTEAPRPVRAVRLLEPNFHTGVPSMPSQHFQMPPVVDSYPVS